MTASSDDVNKLIRALDRNTAAILAAAACGLADGKPSLNPTTAMTGAVRSAFEQFLKEVAKVP